MISSQKKIYSINPSALPKSIVNRVPIMFYYISGLICLCFLVYWPVFTHQFQFFWDDQWVVMNDYSEGGINGENIAAILTEFYHGQYAPVNQFFYLVLYTVFGYSPFWFHTASLLVHTGNVLLVFFLIKKLLKLSGNFGTSSVLRIAFITSLLLAVHPLMVESVSWMAASKCILFALFYLLALRAYLSYLTSQNMWYYGLTILLFVLSFGAKEQAVTMPLCLLLLDYVLKRDLKNVNIYFEKLPFLCLSICFGIITFYSQAFNNEGVLSLDKHYPIYQDLVFGTYTLIEYIIKILLPLKLNYLYPFPNLPGEPLPIYLWVYPVLLIFVTISFWKFWSKKWILFGIGFFIIQISIVSNVIPTSRFAILADRYVYLPSIGIFFLLAYLLDISIQQKKRLSYMIQVVAFLYLICLGLYARDRSKVWRNSDALKQELKEKLNSRSDYRKLMEKQGLK